MGLFSFIKNAGEKLFGKNEEEVQKEAAANLYYVPFFVPSAPTTPNPCQQFS